MLKKIFTHLAFTILLLPALVWAEDPTTKTIDDMQKQVMELQDKITALKQIQKKEEPDVLQIENKKRYQKMAQTRGQQDEMIYRSSASGLPTQKGRNFEFYGGATMWAHKRGNNETTATTTNDGMDAGYSLDLFLEINLLDNQKFIVYSETGDGSGVNQSIGAYSNPNYDAFNTNDSGNTDMTISSAYYEGLLFDEKLLLSIGKMDVHSLYDENEFAGDETTQFMNNLFVRSTGVSFKELNNYYAPGLRAMLTPIETFEISLVLANSNFNDVDDQGLAVFQVNFKPSNILFGGNYRFFWVFDDRQYTSITTGGIDNNVGWGLSFDQRFNEWFGAFFRLSSLDDDLIQNAVKGTWSLGGQINGLLWNRPDDALGIAYGVAWVNNRIVGLANYNDEKHFEAYYRYSVNEYVALSPNIQIVREQPRANPSTVAIFGLRGQFDFRL